jgi:quercetin dioxygenase-like cupin family protein
VTSVVHPDDVEPRVEDGLDVRVTFGPHNGCDLEQRLIRFGPGRHDGPDLSERQILLYVVAGEGEIDTDGETQRLEPGTAAFLARGDRFAIENPGPDDLTVVSVHAPAAADASARKRIVRFDDQPEEEASPERRFRYLINEDAGCMEVTQFIGIVDPSKAPFHSHPYDEVGFVLEGNGVAYVEGEEIPLRPGSCFHLAPGQVHCIENSGPGEMRILGVFHPSDSPASRTYQATSAGNSRHRDMQSEKEEEG